MMLSKARCTNVTPINADFLMTDPSEPQFSSVTHILLDPSCSGSGIVNRLDHLETEPENDATRENRLAKLAAFQLMMIKHAMRFPNVTKIVYSTCSIHATENEHVVRDALKSEEAGATFTLAPQNEVLPKWTRRGYPDEMDSPDQASSLIRCLPGEDATNGFFVSCFVKHPGGVTRKRKDTSDAEASVSGSRPRKKKKRALQAK
jgi:putative methyltransferase